MKKLLIGFLITCVAQGSVLLGYDNINTFYSDDAPVKEICKNNPKAWILWKGSVEKACDCLDYKLGTPDELFKRFVKDHKQDLHKQQLLTELIEKKADELNQPDALKLEYQALDIILSHENDDVKNTAKDEYVEVFVKAFNGALREARSTLEE